MTNEELDNVTAKQFDSMTEEERDLCLEAKRKRKMEHYLSDPHCIEFERKFRELKNKMREGYRPIKTAEIENLFFKWIKVDYSRKRYFKIETLMEHIIQRETSLNNDVEYLKKMGNSIAFSSILAKLCIKYQANCRKFNDGKKRYALTLI
jgi:hypothetical protein